MADVRDRGIAAEMAVGEQRVRPRPGEGPGRARAARRAHGMVAFGAALAGEQEHVVARSAVEVRPLRPDRTLERAVPDDMLLADERHRGEVELAHPHLGLLGPVAGSASRVPHHHARPSSSNRIDGSMPGASSIHAGSDHGPAGSVRGHHEAALSAVAADERAGDVEPAGVVADRRREQPAGSGHRRQVELVVAVHRVAHELPVDEVA